MFANVMMDLNFKPIQVTYANQCVKMHVLMDVVLHQMYVNAMKIIYLTIPHRNAKCFVQIVVMEHVPHQMNAYAMKDSK